MPTMEETLRARLQTAQNPMGVATQGMATTATALSNINAPSAMQANSLVKAHMLRHQKPFLPQKPKEGETVFHSTFAVNNFHMPDGRIVEVRNHFCTVKGEDDFSEVAHIAKATRTLSVYEGPWAEKSEETPNQE